MNLQGWSKQNHEELHDLEKSLRNMLPDTRPLPDVEERVWREIERHQGEEAARRRAPIFAWRIAAAATCAAIFFIGGLAFVRMVGSRADRGTGAAMLSERSSSPSPSSRRDLHFAALGTPQTVKSRSLRDDGRGSDGLGNDRGTKNLGNRGRSHKAGASRRLLVRSHTALRHHVGSHVEVRLAKATTVKSEQHVARLPAEVAWASWGAWYEQQGDYDRAAASYRNAEELAARKVIPASAAVSTYQYTYQAGRTAECAGDVTAAIDYYAKMLFGAPASKPSHDPDDANEGHEKSSGDKPEKGALIWRPLDISA